MLLAGCGSGDFTTVSGGGGRGINAGGGGTASLAWSAPTTNADGTPIYDLAGYKIYYGTTSGTYTKTIVVAGSGSTTYQLTGLAAGDYFLALTAYDTSGNESILSGEVMKTVT